MDNVCQYLTKYYDCNILSSLPEDIKKIVYNVSKYFHDKDVGNPILLRLIKNHFDVQKPVTEFISGPFSISCQQSKKYNKKIYIFGEMHERGYCEPTETGSNKVVSIENYLEQLFEHTDVFIDFYIEFGLSTVNTQQYYDNDDNRWKIFKYLHSREKYEHKLFRAHYVDIRQILDKDRRYSNKITSFFVHVMSALNTRSSRKMHKKDKKYIKEIRDFVINSDIFYNLLQTKEDIIIFFRNEIMNDKYFKKEVDRSYIKEDLCRFVDISLLNLFDELNVIDAMKKISHDINFFTTYENLFDTLDHLTYIVLVLHSCILDIYTLSRIFKKFKTSDSENRPDEPCNIIIYLGDHHSKNIRYFLNSIGFDTTDETCPEKTTTCVDMRNIRQPFFSS